MYNDMATLIKAGTATTDDEGNPTYTDQTERTVDVKAASIGMKEFYQASTTDLKPDLKLIIPDMYDYDGEKTVKYNGKTYDIVRTYVSRGHVELTLTERIARKG